MSSITEQFSAATKSQLEAQFQIFSTLASTAFNSAEKFIALNLNTTKASVEKSSAAARQLLAIKDPKELFNLSAATPPSLDGLLAYGRELASIAATAQSELIKSAQNSFKQVTELTATKAEAASKATPPALAAAISAAVTAVNEPVAPAKIAKPKPLAAPIPEADSFIEVKAQLKPSFPAPAAPKPISLAPATKPPKPAPKSKPSLAAPKAKK
jgi:phasin family protein